MASGDDMANDPSSAPGCPGLQDLEPFVLGRPDRAIESHLDACDRCRRRAQEMRAANRFLARFGPGDEPARSSAGSLLVGGGAPAIRARGYEVESLVASGGQGAVYRARQLGTGRTVALKAPLGDTLRRPGARFRFQREIELAARLDHPGIVRVLGDCELDDGRVGCVMEFVEGEPFDRWAAARRAEGRAGLRRVVEAAAEVADAIAYAHQRAVLHRDIKPSNVVVTPEGAPHVLDFGLAKALDENGASFATQTGAFVGTLAYAAPEQVSAGADAIDLRTDVYALGLLVYQALTGRLPHATDAPSVEILRQIRELAPARPSSLAEGVDDDLDAVVLMALAKEKDRRYASAGEFRDDLRAWLEGRAVRARFDSRWYVLRKTARRHRWAVAISVSALAALAVMIVFGQIAREQAARARLADAVRDARVLESHWVRMAEARSIGLDSFEAGERAAWDSFLEPERVLVRESVEGFGPDGPSPTSPAYWALWEMYQRSPVVATIPEAGRVTSGYDGATDELVTILAGTARITWWDWRRGTPRRFLDLPMSVAPTGLRIAPTSGRVCVTNGAEPAALVDPLAARASPVGEFPTVLVGITARHLAVSAGSAPDSQELVLWDIASDPPRPRARWPLLERANSIAFDRTGRYLAVATYRGELLLVDADQALLLLRRGPGDEPRFTSAHSRGNDGEFILYGPEKCAVVHADGDPERDIAQALPKGGFLDGLRILAGARGGDRYVCVSDRWRFGVGDKRDPITEGRYLAAISVGSAAMSDDGRFVASSLRPSGRGAVIDLDSPGVRRLSSEAPITVSGFPTVTGLGFLPDGRSLVAGVMDGSLRRFDTISGSSLPVPVAPLPGGIATICVAGDDVYAGTHDLGLTNARLVRVRGGVAETLVAGGERWFTGIAVDRGRAAWALTGEGHLLMLDPETGMLLREAHLVRHHEISTFRALERLPHRRLLLAGPAGAGIEILDEDTLAPAAPSVAMPAIRAIAVGTADPDLVATAGEDGMIRLWRFRPGPPPALEPVLTFGAHAGDIYCLAFSPDGRLIASGGGTPESRDVRLWDVRRGRELAALDLFELGVFDLAFSPDGRWLAAGGEVRLDHPEEGGQLFLIDLLAPDRCIAGNLEYHILRFEAERGRLPSQSAAFRTWAARVLGDAGSP